MSENSVQRFEFADLTLDVGRRQLFRGGELIRLTKLDFDVLRTLVVAAPNLVTRESLAKEAWGPRRVVTPENLSQRIKLLRRQLHDTAAEPRYIEGVRGLGYRLVPGVRAISGPDAMPGSTAGAVVAESRGALANSVAVLPLENLSPDPAHAYFSNGMHAEIINQLARLQNVNAIARTSVQKYADSAKPLSEIAAELGVETVLEGSVRYYGERVRVSVNLINPAYGTSLWSDSYERDLVDVFEIQTDIAVNVADALEAELVGCERQGMARRPTSSPDAYALYMQALGLSVMHDTGEHVRSLLDRALELDPDFAEAYGLAAYRRAMSYINTMNQEAIDAAHRDALEHTVRSYAKRALDLDPHVAIAHAAVAMIDLVTWHWTEAREGFDHAHELGWSLDISPWVYSWLGDHEQAIERARRVVELSPNDWIRHRHLGVTLAYAREYESALQVLRNAAAMAPGESLTLVWILYAQVAQGRHAEASESIAMLEKLLGDVRPVVILPELAYVYRRLDMHSQAQRIVEEIRLIAAERDIGTGAWAMANLAMGDEEAVLTWLERAAGKIRRHEPDQSAINLLNMKMNFLCDPVLDGPVFGPVLDGLRGD